MRAFVLTLGFWGQFPKDNVFYHFDSSDFEFCFGECMIRNNRIIAQFLKDCKKNKKNWKKACNFFQSMLQYGVLMWEWRLYRRCPAAQFCAVKIECLEVNLCLKEGKAAASEAYNFVVKKTDQAVAKGILHKNTAARRKSQYAAKLNKIA